MREDTEYKSTDMRILHTANDSMVVSLVRGISDIERCQKLLKAEHSNQARSWVIRKLERQMREIREYDILD